MVGWIKVHRKLMDHWLWDDPRRLKWWIAVLLEVNYTDGKMNFGNKLITVKRGSSTKSLRAWGEVFGCGTKAVTNFFDLLESDQMISRETIRRGKHSTTLIKITNYEDYQDKEEKPKETLKQTSKNLLKASIGQRERDTIKEGKKNNKERKREETRALDFLKNNYPSRFETDFVMRYAKKIQNKEKFKFDFEDTVDQEGLEWTDKILFARLGKYSRNWIENQNKYAKQNNTSNDVDKFYKNIPTG